MEVFVYDRGVKRAADEDQEVEPAEKKAKEDKDPLEKIKSQKPKVLDLDEVLQISNLEIEKDPELKFTKDVNVSIYNRKIYGAAHREMHLKSSPNVQFFSKKCVL